MTLLDNPVVFDFKNYVYLSKYATLMHPPSRPLIGRHREKKRLLSSLNRPELSNAFLLGDAGSGKTMLVQGCLEDDPTRIYVEVNLPKMAASDQGEDGSTQMASRIKGLFDDAILFKETISKTNDLDSNTPKPELVLFIDEFHLLIQLSPAAAQAIKPMLAESGRLGIKVIAATTFAEFHEYVEKDQALMQRLQRINIHAPEKDDVIRILKSIATVHRVTSHIYDDSLFNLIYEYSERYIPADSQPRKSILLLDSMIGWFKSYPQEYQMNKKLLADVIYDSVGVKVSFDIDASSIEYQLNNSVFSQKFAMSVIEKRLQISIADMHDKSRPLSSFLFAGSTGTGKTETAKTLNRLLFNDDKAMIRFDMSEYALDTSLDRFREELTMKVWNKSHSLILCDEIEKANPVITRLLLQVLDDGRLSNKQGREVSFLNTYIIMTTNAGSEIYKEIANYDASDDGSTGMYKYNKIIRQSLMGESSFPSELINRMNAIIPFQPLSSRTYEDIIRKKIQTLVKSVKKLHGVTLTIEAKLIPYLVYETFDIETDSGGARGLIANMESVMVSPIARFINQYPDIKSIGVVVSGEMRHENKTQLRSDASIVVAKYDNKEIKR